MNNPDVNKAKLSLLTKIQEVNPEARLLLTEDYILKAREGYTSPITAKDYRSLWDLFEWKDTPEGHCFWEKIAYEVGYIKND